MTCDEKDEWAQAERKEVENMVKHGVWIERAKTRDMVIIPSTWAYKKKLGADNQVVEYKARICAQGF